MAAQEFKVFVFKIKVVGKQLAKSQKATAKVIHKSYKAHRLDQQNTNSKI